MRQALSSKNKNDLKSLAKLVPGLRLSTTKDKMVHELAAAIEEGVDDLLEQLDPLEQAMLSHAVHDEWWWYDVIKFAAIHGKLPKQEIYSRGAFGWQAPVATVMDLFFYDGVLPRDLGERLRAKLKPPVKFEILSSDTFPEAIERVDDMGEEAPPLPLHLQLSEEMALGEVAEVMRLIQDGGLRLSSKTNLPTAASLRKLSETLYAPDWLAEEELWGESEYLEDPGMDVGPIRPYAWGVLFAMTGFLQSSKSKTQLNKKGKELLGKPPAQRLKQLWQEWLKQDRFDELTRASAIKGQTGRAKSDMTPPSQRRHSIVHVLAQVPPNQWVDLEMLLRAMVVQERFPYVTQEGAYGLYIGSSSYGSLAYQSSWEVLEGTYIRLFLLEYAATLGLVDVAYATPDHFRSRWGGAWWADTLSYLSPYDGVTHVRVTPLGAWILGSSPSYQGPKQPVIELQVLPNLEVVCTTEISQRARLKLDAWCTPSGERTWGISRDSLLGGVDRGESLEAFVSFLEESAQHALPQTVTALIKDVRRRAGALSNQGEMVVIEAKSKAIALELAHHRRTKEMCTLVGEKTLLVTPSRGQAFRKAALALGYGSQDP